MGAPKSQKKKQSHETVGETFDTEQKSITLLRQLLPSKWMLREWKPDFHLDYYVEVVDDGELTGRMFGVQLKGIRVVAVKGKPPSFALDCKHLRYYVEKVQFPVFLIRADLGSGKAFWCFIQKFGREKVSAKKRAKQKSVSVSFNREDCFSDLDRFRSALTEAEAYMRELYPSSVGAAINAKRRFLQTIDPRIDPQISIVNNQESISLRPVKEFSFNVIVRGKNTPAFRRAVRDFVEKGKQLKVASSAVTFEDAPLFAQLTAKSPGGSILLDFGKRNAGAVQIYAESNHEEFILEIPGTFKSGTRFLTFEGSLKKAAITVRAVVEAADASGGKGKFSIDFNRNAWRGQKLLQLAHFGPIYTLIERLHNNSTLRLRFTYEGNSVFGCSGIHLPNIAQIFSDIDLLNKGREVARHFRVDPTILNGPYSTKTIDGILDLHQLITIGKFVQRPNGKPIPIDLTLPLGAQASLSTVFIQNLRLRPPCHDFEVFDAKISLQGVMHVFTQVNVTVTEVIGQTAKALIIPTAKSEWTVEWPQQDSIVEKKVE
jgi:hypothetical protein